MSTSSPSSTASAQPSLDLYVVIHISTTADDQGIYITRDNSEIIEIAWSIVDAVSLEENASDAVFVKPMNTPITPLCTSATSLTWDQVKNAGSLKEAIEKLDESIQKHAVTPKKSFAFVTFQSWDLRMKLTKEARERSIVLPAYLELSRHFDLRREFLAYEELVLSPDSATPYTARLNQLTLNTVCQTLAIDVSSIESANGQKPFALSMPRRASDEVQIMKLILGYFAKNAPSGSTILQNPHDMHRDLTQFLGERSKVLYMTNLPIDTTQSELESWFTQFGGRPIAFWTMKAPLERNAQPGAKPTGAGFAVFATHEEAIDSLAMNGRNLTDKVIEVQPSSVVVLDKAQEILAPFPSSKNRPRPGDWTCPSCGFSNFQRRTACFRCSFPAASAAAIQESMYNGPSSGNGQYQQYQSASQSQAQQPQQPQQPQQQINTSLPNLSGIYGTAQRLNSTLSLNSPQPQQQPSQPQQSQQQQNGSSNVPFRAGDWKCINENCSYHNFAKNISCLKCGAPRANSTGTLQHPQPSHEYYLPQQQQQQQQHQNNYLQRTNSANGPNGHNGHNGHNNHARPGYYQQMLNSGSIYQQQHGSSGHLHYTNTSTNASGAGSGNGSHYHTPPQQQYMDHSSALSPAVEDLKHLANRLGGLNLYNSQTELERK
ncbi:unnamed protein product [Kuraishia capsulata CBS 1993]|uniref:Asparagine-rich protein n=1 Tax=Kuraishia capsulata CBS 1993 TaxID=1382522 RepID=W6MY10_9ASCO|nr:uncharacterized protein KUCA_T00005814001 [Kuraishia capsulata CBS 1993]CDK29820.1 unnamed protein product [Kuraishia capsulata CBS 1993]